MDYSINGIFVDFDGTYMYYMYEYHFFEMISFKCETFLFSFKNKYQ